MDIEQPSSAAPVDPSNYDLELAIPREEIDAIDGELVDLLNRRAKCALEVVRIKMSHNLPIFVSSREEAVLDRICSLNNEELIPSEYIRSLFQAIMKVSRGVQQKAWDNAEGSN